jgi:hypothetical protein
MNGTISDLSNAAPELPELSSLGSSKRREEPSKKRQSRTGASSTS